jgi:hypothetical protein
MGKNLRKAAAQENAQSGTAVELSGNSGIETTSGDIVAASGAVWELQAR